MTPELNKSSIENIEEYKSKLMQFADELDRLSDTNVDAATVAKILYGEPAIVTLIPIILAMGGIPLSMFSEELKGFILENGVKVGEASLFIVISQLLTLHELSDKDITLTENLNKGVNDTFGNSAIKTNADDYKDLKNLKLSTFVLPKLASVVRRLALSLK